MYCARMISIFYLGISLLVSGCGNMAGNMAASGYLATQQDKAVKYPQASGGFQPKKMYNSTVDELWATVSIVLENNRITLTQMDKQNGRIYTDFIEGQTESKAGGALGVITTRYKYDVIIDKVNETTTRLGILCKLESKSAFDKLTDWHDVSNENKHVLVILENWLYEQIEKTIENDQGTKKNEAWKKSGAADINKYANGFSGKWVGVCTCSKDEIYGNTLTISANSTDLSATVEVYPNEQGHKFAPGSYSSVGKFFSDGSFNLEPTVWIKQIPKFGMDTFSGKINNQLNELTGTIKGSPCSFQLKK